MLKWQECSQQLRSKCTPCYSKEPAANGRYSAKRRGLTSLSKGDGFTGPCPHLITAVMACFLVTLEKEKGRITFSQEITLSNNIWSSSSYRRFYIFFLLPSPTRVLPSPQHRSFPCILDGVITLHHLLIFV